MVPKMGPDEDGDVPPCSVMWSYEQAKAWDTYKKKKYNGKQKAVSRVKLFRERQWKLWKRRWFSCFYTQFRRG